MEALILKKDELIRQLSETKLALREFGEDKGCINYFLERTRSSTKMLMNLAMEGYSPIYGTQYRTWIF